VLCQGLDQFCPLITLPGVYLYSRPEYPELIEPLSKTEVTKALLFSVDVGRVKLKFYGSMAIVKSLGKVEEHVKIIPPPNPLWRVFSWLELYHRYDRAKRRAFVVTTTEQGHETTNTFTQEAQLRFPFGREATFEFRCLGSKGLSVSEGDYVLVVFASTGIDLVPFSLRVGTHWLNMWGDVIERLESAGIRVGDRTEARIRGESGYVRDVIGNKWLPGGH